MNPVGHGLTRVVRAYGGIPKAAAISPISVARQLQLYSALAHNRCGATIDVALLRRMSTTGWKVHRKATSTYTDQTAALQAGTNVAFFAANNDDLYIGCKRPFGLFGMTITTGEAGSPVYAYTYYNGSSFSALTLVESLSAYSAGDKKLVFIPPYDWAVGGDSNLDQSYYYVRVRSTTLSTTPVGLTAGWFGEMLAYREGVVDNGTLLLDATVEPLMFEGGEGLFPYFGTANAANLIEASYKSMG